MWELTNGTNWRHGKKLLSEEDKAYRKRYSIMELSYVLIPFVSILNWSVAIGVLLLSGFLLFIGDRFRQNFLKKLWQKKNIKLTIEEKEFLLIRIVDMVQDHPVSGNGEFIERLMNKGILYQIVESDNGKKAYYIQNWVWDFLRANKEVLKTE